MSGTKGDGEKNDSLKRQGSYRKIISQNTNGESSLSMSVKMVDRPTIVQTKDYAVFLQEYSILSEYNMLGKQDLKGIYVIPSAQNSLVWFGVQFVQQGVYRGGVFRFTITLPESFPEGGCPKVVFQTHVFHPLIDPETGELCTSWEFSTWKRDNRVWKLIQYITKVFTRLNVRMTPMNEKASILFENNFDAFRELARQCVQESLNQVYDPPPVEDPHYITFSPYIPELHDPIKKQIYEHKEEEENRALGLSWVQPGSLQPFSKPDSR